MGEALARLRDVTKRYGRFEAVSHLSWTVERGGIYGLIGENGAGKSTLIRIVNGLTRPTSGEVAIFGETCPKEVRRARSRIGYMPDANASYPNLSARDNLTVRCIEWGIPCEGVVERVLGLIGLADTGGKRAGSFSLGMRRRLDLGIALLGDPELLILDEPTNGLDPMGIVEVRRLLVDLNARSGKTILVSSHNLEELHKLATHFAFMSRGRLLAAMPAEELEARCERSLVLRVDDAERARRLLAERLPGVSVTRGQDGALRLGGGVGASDDAVALLSAGGVRVREAFLGQQSLEEYYTELIASGGDAR